MAFSVVSMRTTQKSQLICMCAPTRTTLPSLLSKLFPKLMASKCFFLLFLEHKSKLTIPILNTCFFILRQSERHPKSFEMAQEEVLTCVGFFLYERFFSLYQAAMIQEQAWQILFYTCVLEFVKKFRVKNSLKIII